ncbi:MAG: FHA domain-containing protein [Burkholderiaceae bacterium]|jgi:class 3 adenylate cyclase|nr:FHA domain-containing protein [Burkholderiaceae bacterium]
MTRIIERTVLFADLRGSTALYETLGNAEATSVVTHTVSALAATVDALGGQVVKTLGDGLMAVFAQSQPALDASQRMHDALDHLVSRGHQRGASSGLRGLRLQVALACGEVVEMAGDCFGDAVNVAARLLDHAGDNETLVTAEVLAGLPPASRAAFRCLDRLRLRGRVEPVQVYLRPHRAPVEGELTQFGDLQAEPAPEGLRLAWLDVERMFDVDELPVVLGRSQQASFCVDDSRVSRSHARIDWHGGAYQLTDLSYNGTYVRFGTGGDVLVLRRGTCTLHGRGSIGLGASPAELGAAVVQFEVVHERDTEPQPLPMPDPARA